MFTNRRENKRGTERENRDNRVLRLRSMGISRLREFFDDDKSCDKDRLVTSGARRALNRTDNRASAIVVS